MGVQISPSILSADFTDLAGEVARIAPAADWVHVDVMDNHFVPNLTLGLPVVERLAEVSDAAARRAPDDRGRRPLGARATPTAGARQRHLPRRGRAAPVRLARDLRAHGVRAGMALRPATAGRAVRRPAARAGHAAADDGRARLRRPGVPRPGAAEDPGRPASWSRAATCDLWIQVDGGVAAETIERCAEAGADVFVAGSAVYGADDPAAAVQGCRQQAAAATAGSWWGRP